MISIAVGAIDSHDFSVGNSSESQEAKNQSKVKSVAYIYSSLLIVAIMGSSLATPKLDTLIREQVLDNESSETCRMLAVALAIDSDIAAWDAIFATSLERLDLRQIPGQLMVLKGLYTYLMPSKMRIDSEKRKKLRDIVSVPLAKISSGTSDPTKRMANKLGKDLEAKARSIEKLAGNDNDIEI